MKEKKTLVLGASLNSDRYSNMAVRKLRYAGFPVVAVGQREGEISGVYVEKPYPPFTGVHTVTLYMGAKNLRQFHDYILELHPERVIFNPGSESPELAEKLGEAGIEVVYGCTLVMIANGEY
ncbi:MAG TPA: CoA-binding protein [Bacteroidales bacterium]|nr:CoA-binding protein [Bacteroidales bacterium]HPS61935.1 CoA-binding protein [Bacteroidales bacterium]